MLRLRRLRERLSEKRDFNARGRARVPFSDDRLRALRWARRFSALISICSKKGGTLRSSTSRFAIRSGAGARCCGSTASTSGAERSASIFPLAKATTGAVICIASRVISADTRIRIERAITRSAIIGVSNERIRKSTRRTASQFYLLIPTKGERNWRSLRLIGTSSRQILTTRVEKTGN